MTYDPDLRLLFLHVPKCGGTSMVAALRDQFPADQVFDTYHVEMDTIETENYRFITGHFGYRDVAQLPFKRVTVIRDPIDRFLSHMYYWKARAENGRPNGHFADAVVTRSLEELLDHMEEGNPVPPMDNLLTWTFAVSENLWARRTLQDQTPDQVLDIAKQNLLRFDVVGCLEDLPGFQADLERVLGLTVDFEVLNTTKSRPKQDALPDTTLHRLRQLLALDIALYEWVRGQGAQAEDA